MKFERAATFARDTPTDALCAAWGLTDGEVISRQKGETPMTIREVGDLAFLHGLKLLDVLTV